MSQHKINSQACSAMYPKMIVELSLDNKRIQLKNGNGVYMYGQDFNNLSRPLVKELEMAHYGSENAM